MDEPPGELSSIPLLSEAESVSEIWKGDVEDLVRGILEPRDDSHILAWQLNSRKADAAALSWLNGLICNIDIVE